MPARLQHQDSDRIVNIDKPILFVGRHPECDLVISDSRKVSRKHCCLAEINGNFVLRDLGSTNGVQVNGQRVHGTISLSAGDQVIIGDIPYTFLLGAAPKASPKPAPPAIKTNPPRPAPIQEKPEPVPYPNSEMSSEIPIMLDDPDDGFDILGGSSRSNRQQERRMAGSDSRPELVAD